MKTIVIGLGNTLLRDDGAGIYVVRLLRRLIEELEHRPEAELIEAELAGMDIIEKLEGFDKAIIIDAIQLRGFKAGTVFRLRPDDFRTTPRLASFHDIDLVTALELGRRLELSMPEDVLILAIQAEDTVTIEEGCTSVVEAVIEDVAKEVLTLLTGKSGKRVSIPLGPAKET